MQRSVNSQGTNCVSRVDTQRPCCCFGGIPVSPLTFWYGVRLIDVNLLPSAFLFDGGGSDTGPWKKKTSPVRHGTGLAVASWIQ